MLRYIYSWQGVRCVPINYEMFWHGKRARGPVVIACSSYYPLKSDEARHNSSILQAVALKCTNAPSSWNCNCYFAVAFIGEFRIPA